MDVVHLTLRKHAKKFMSNSSYQEPKKQAVPWYQGWIFIWENYVAMLCYLAHWSCILLFQHFELVKLCHLANWTYDEVKFVGCNPSCKLFCFVEYHIGHEGLNFHANNRSQYPCSTAWQAWLAIIYILFLKGEGFIGLREHPRCQFCVTCRIIIVRVWSAKPQPLRVPIIAI